MVNNLKALGLAVVAMFALSAMAASSASAVDTFTVSPSPLTVTGVGTDNILKITNASGGTIVAVECTTAHFESTVANGASSTTVKAKYTGRIGETPHGEKCTISGGTATVSMNGCDYVASGNTTGSDGGTDAILSIVCTTSAVTIATNFACTLEIPAQTPTSGGVKYTNEMGGKVKITATSTGVTFSSIGPGCALAGIPSEGNNFDITGNVMLSSASGSISFSQS